MAMIPTLSTPARQPRTMRACLLAAVLAGSAILSAPALAQMDMTNMSNRLSRLENELQTLSRQVYRGGPAPAGSAVGGVGMPSGVAADFEVRLSRLETEIRTLTGQYEEATFGVAQLRDRLDKLSSDIDFRLSQMEAKLNAAPEAGSETPPAATQQQSSTASGKAAPTSSAAAAPAKPAAKNGGQQQAALTQGSPQEQYDRAFGLMRNADYENAEAELTQFLKKNGDNSLAPNARYWLGETYYVRGKFSEAAMAFAEGYQKSPKGPKAADNLLKLGMSLGQLKQKNDACVAFKQLAAEFPDAPATVKRRAEQERGRLSCP